MKWFSRMLSVSAISVAEGRCVLLKGKLERRLLSDLAGELACSRGIRGEIWINGDGRIRFSDGIPPELHQRLRNILMQR